MNAIHAIAPYKWCGLWVFDDPHRNIFREPFVSTYTKMIDKAVLGVIPRATEGFVMLFSDEPFPGCEYTLDWVCSSGLGNIYMCREMHTSGWLCPALLKYFGAPPDHIYVQLLPKGNDHENVRDNG